MTVWYSADLHLGHRNILTHVPSRPWSSVEEMDAGLVERWNEVVAPGDTVWVLGDVALHPGNLGPVADLNGHKILVAGNHDDCWLGHRRHGARNSLLVYAAAGFEQVIPEGFVGGHDLGGHAVNLSHLPYRGDHTDTERYTRFRPVDDGLPLLCGHVHDAWRVSDRQVNVGVDVWGWRPVAADTLVGLLDRTGATCGDAS